MTALAWLRPVVEAALTPAARRHAAAWADPAAAQDAARARIWEGLRETRYGERFPSFAALPVVEWDQMAPYMARQQAGEAGVVTRDRVLFWEPTSGSGGAPKRVPYTAALRRCFSSMFAVWAHDVLTRGPRLRSGRIWFSVTPRFDAPERAGDGAPVGTADDRDYLDGPLRALVDPFWVAPRGLAAARDPEAWRRCVARTLCARRDLEGISVWSPTLLTVLLDWMEEHRDELPNGERIGDWPALWPDLRFVSCWDAGSAALPAQALRARLPGVLVQGKGLLATECPVTVPRIGHDDTTAPLVADVVIELLDHRGDLLPLVAGRAGEHYDVVVSQPAGLARYRLGDVVEVHGSFGACPGLRFLGRRRTSDLVGEKLTEAAVAAALALAEAPPGCALIAAGDHYRLEVDAASVPDQLAARVDAALQREHHYRLARQHGQLGVIEAVAHPGRARAHLDAAPVWGADKGSVLRS